MTMMIKKLHILYVVLFLVCIKSFSFGFEFAHEDANSTIIRCIERERQALLMFKRGIVSKKEDLAFWGGEVDSEDLSSWGSEEDCCIWIRVECSGLTGHVTSLSLPFVKHFSFKMTSSLIELKSLNYLDFHNNDFGSMPIPNFIGSLTSLVYLDLSFSNLNGPIPYQLRNLSNLKVLSLSGNNFVSNPIPEFIGSFAKLEDLKLGSANFSGAIPYQLGNLSNLNYLDLSDNEGLYGNLDWLSRLSSLTVLALSGVDLSRANGWVDIIKALPFLSYLNLGDCNLSRVMAPSLSSTNSSSSISILVLSSNNLTFSTSHWLFNLSSSLLDLDLSENLFKGSIPDAFGYHLTSLTYLSLEHNQVKGVLPKSLGTLCNLKSLSLGWNNLNGSLEDFLSGCATQSLESLDLSYNQLAGPLDDFKGWSSLQELDLSNNQYTGSVPVFREYCPSLKTLILSNNQFSALLPETFGQLFNLKYLDISNNSLQVVITKEHFSNLSNLWSLDLSFNTISFNWSPQHVSLQLLDALRMRSCKLGPRFPEWIKTQKFLPFLDLSNNKSLKK